ncbi:MAG TPA: hypothetical protein VLA31_03625, partial [Burkholderiaceae bacterium]|nr:hypothetical protein [Burkholderiaceae bacterium]
LLDDFVALDITTVRSVGAWRGFVFVGNVISEGEVYQNRIFWSDFNDPLSFVPGPESLAGYIDLGEDERVLAMAPLGAQFRVYTDKAIYNVDLVGGDEVFNFREVYRGPQVLRFENSLVNLGELHIYGGEDTIYVIGEFDRAPRILDWLYRASGAIYGGVSSDYLSGVTTSSFPAFGPINRGACHLLTGGYDEAERMVWFSWAPDAESVPSKSLVLQMDIGKACLVDSGFTAFVSHLPSYQANVRRWLADIGACPPDPLPGEGNPLPITFVLDNSLTCIRSTSEHLAFKKPPEADIEALSVTPGASLCSKIDANPALEPDCTPCGNGYKFIMASSQDKCLKEYTPEANVRTYCTTDPNDRSGLAWTTTNHPTTVVTYGDYGYTTLLQTDAQDMGTPNNKTVSRALVEYDAPDVPDDNAAMLHFDVGYGSQPHRLIWQTSAPRKIDRLSSQTEGQMAANNIRPNRMATYQFFRSGSQIGFRLMIANASRNPVIGGSCSLNEMNVSIRSSHGDYF